MSVQTLARLESAKAFIGLQSFAVPPMDSPICRVLPARAPR
jgi:hypothetical protein